MTDHDLLNRLCTDPGQGDFQRVRDFLVNYGVPWAPNDLANQYLGVWPQMKPHIQKLAGNILETCDLTTGSELSDAVQDSYGLLQYPWVWGGDTVASKTLHFFNPGLVMMWDDPIKSAHVTGYGAAAYLVFLQEMQTQAQEVMSDFQQLSLPGRPEEYLSKKLGYSYTRPLTKLLDDYNWMTITKEWPPDLPDWLHQLLDIP